MNYIEHNGIKWLDTLRLDNGDITFISYNEAAAYAKSIGARLPTSMELHEACVSGFLSEKVWFWSSTIHPYYLDEVYCVNTLNGNVHNCTRSSLGFFNRLNKNVAAVRCILLE